jgi:hypothetical protein
MVHNARRYRLSRLQLVLKRGAMGLLRGLLRLRIAVSPARAVSKDSVTGTVVVIDRCLGIGDALMISPALRLLREHGPVAVVAHIAPLLDADLDWRRTTSWREQTLAVRTLAAEGRRLLVPFTGFKGLTVLLRWPGRLPPGVIVLDARHWIDTVTGRIGAVTGAHYSDPPLAAARALVGRAPAPDGEAPVSRLPPRMTNPAANPAANPADGPEGAIGPYIAIAPWATAATRRWPLTHWAGLIDRLAEARPGFAFVLLGSADERPHGEAIRERVGCATARVVNAMGELDLAATAGVIARARLLLCCDNGPMHLGIGVGVPVLAVFGSTDPATRLAGPRAGALFDPLLCPSRRAPCYAGYQREPACPTAIECLSAMTPERVAARAIGHLDG